MEVEGGRNFFGRRWLVAVPTLTGDGGGGHILGSTFAYPSKMEVLLIIILLRLFCDAIRTKYISGIPNGIPSVGELPSI